MEIHETEARGGEEIVLEDLPIGHDHPEIDALGRERGGMLGPEPFGLADGVAGRAGPGGHGVGLDLLAPTRGTVGLRVDGDDDDPRQAGGRAEGRQRDFVGAEEHQAARNVRRGGGHHGEIHFRA